MDNSDLPTPLCDKEYQQVVSDISSINFSSPQLFTDSKLEQEIENLIQASQAKASGTYKAAKIVCVIQLSIMFCMYTLISMELFSYVNYIKIARLLDVFN